jgi:hypothetical protein
MHYAHRQLTHNLSLDEDQFKMRFVSLAMVATSDIPDW